MNSSEFGRRSKTEESMLDKLNQTRGSSTANLGQKGFPKIKKTQDVRVPRPANKPQGQR